MANEQTSVQLYAASEVLTAANMNISAGTGVPVFATTVTRDAAFGGASEKVLAEGQLCYLSASNIVQYYDGAAWATVGPATAGGLTLISTVTSTAAAQILFDSVFSATYTNYLLLMTVKGSASTGLTGALRLAGVTVSGADYYRQRTNSDSTTVAGVRSSAATEWGFPNLDTNFNMSYVTIAGPALAQTTGGWMIGGGGATTIANNTSTMYHNVATAYDGIIILPASGTITGTSSIYGYSK